jgi:hypothetical protein
VLGRCFQAVQGSMVSSRELGAAGLTTERLDPLDTAMLAISDEGVDVSIGDLGVRAQLVGTSVALGVHPLGCSPPAFHLSPRSRHLQALTLHPTREWRRDDKRGNRLGSGVGGVGGAWCVWPLLVRTSMSSPLEGEQVREKSYEVREPFDQA